MSEINLYSTGCPKCNVLKAKLDSKKVQYKLITDVEQMKNLGFMSAPILQVDGSCYTFGEAVKMINNLGEDFR